MVLGSIVLAVALIVGAPVWVALVLGAAVGVALMASSGHRRRERARRAAEFAARKAERKVERRTERKATIRDRTGLDVDLVSRAAHDAVHAVGSKITSRLEARYATPHQPEHDDWLDLDTDFDVMRSRATTAEALRLNDELARSRR